MANDKTKAKRAMAISDQYKEVIKARQMVEVELLKLQEMISAEKHPEFDSADILKLRLDYSKAFHKEIIDGHSRWHNVAFERGYFDVDSGPRKLSKSDQYK